MIQLLIKIYSFLLGLYPPAFRNEFREQMLLDFSDMVIDADAKGKSYLFRFCIREMFDFPLNLLRVHGKENKMLCSKSLNFGLRGAVGFGVVYTLTFQIVKFIYAKLSFIDDIVAQWQVSYYDQYHIEKSYAFISQIPYFLSLLISGLLLGCLFAILFAERSQYAHYFWVGTLGWLLQNLIGWVLMSFNFWVFLTEIQYTYFSYMMMVLSGAVWGLIFAVVKSERQNAVGWLAVGMVGYPLFAYLWVKGLFNLFVFQTPWRFIGTTTVIVILVISIFVLARNLDLKRRFPWVVIASIVGYLMMRPFVFLVGRWLYPPMFALNTALESTSLIVSETLYGVIWGLFLGLIIGFQKKSGSQQAMA
jgi:hypothetical protein